MEEAIVSTDLKTVMDPNRNPDLDPNRNTDLKTMMDPNCKWMPEEILFNIMTRLSLKSLYIFRCVSKSWLSFILARFRPKLLISVQHKRMCNFFSIDYPEQSDTQPLHATYCSSTELGDPPMMISQSQSPSGLICFSCSEGIKIGNPISGDFGVIPYPKCSRTRPFFFGFDPVEKRQVILRAETRPANTRSVFDLLDNTWHETENPSFWTVYDSDDICINGVIYFSSFYGRFSSPNTGVDICLYAFDVRLKSFKRIIRPPNSINQLFLVELLFEYKGQVAVVGYGDLRDTSVDDIKMWILEDAENHIWSFKSFVVPWSENLTRDGISTDGMQTWDWDSYLKRNFKVKVKVNLLCATHRGELILATSLWNPSPYLFFYDIETTVLRRFQVDGFGKTPCRVLRFNLFIDTLQSVPKCCEKKKRSRKRDRELV